MATTYEWVAEEVDRGSEDIVDVWHFDTFREAKAQAEKFMTAVTRGDVGLVRDDNDGRSWAYLEQGVGLAERLTDAGGKIIAKVPKRFLAEVK